MKKIFALIIVIALIFTLCSCKKINNDVSSSIYSESTHSSETSSVTSETEESDPSNTESDDTVSNITVSTPVDNTSSEQVVDNASKEESEDTSSKEHTTEEKPKEPINFVPKQWPGINPDLTFNYEDTHISYYQNVFYKGVRYACAAGQNNGVACSAVVTVGDNDEFLKCISIFDSANNERSIFNIYNDRIYYLQCQPNDTRDYTLLETLSICSVNLSGEDKRVEKKVELPFTHIMSGQPSNYQNSNYLFFTVSNLFDGVYDEIYRYNIATNELINLNMELGSRETMYPVGEKVFVWDYDYKKIYEYDIDLKNKKLFYETGASVHLVENGFILKVSQTGKNYFLDLNGNISEK